MPVEPRRKVTDEELKELCFQYIRERRTKENLLTDMRGVLRCQIGGERLADMWRKCGGQVRWRVPSYF